MRSFIAWIVVIGFPFVMWAVFAVMMRRAKKGRPVNANKLADGASTNAASEGDGD